MKVYIVEWSGCECGGAEKIAFASHELAQKWIDSQPYDLGVDYREIIEVELMQEGSLSNAA